MKNGMQMLWALAFVISAIPNANAGTNFPAVNDYPLPNCIKPGAAPVLRDDAREHNGNSLISSGPNDDAVQEFNEKLARYNAAQLAYHSCIYAYIANAQVDLNMIRSKASKPVPNLPSLKDYPGPECGEPVGVPLPEGGTMDTLSQRVSNYNALLLNYNKYIACMNTYMSNVQADTSVIQNILNKAIADSNQ